MIQHFNQAHAAHRALASAICLTEYGQCGACFALRKINANGTLHRHKALHNIICTGSGSSPSVGSLPPAVPKLQRRASAQAVQQAAAAAAAGQQAHLPLMQHNVGAPPVLRDEEDWKPHAAYRSDDSWLSAITTILTWYAKHLRTGDTPASERCMIKLLQTPLPNPPRRKADDTGQDADAGNDEDDTTVAEHEKLFARVQKTVTLISAGLTKQAVDTLLRPSLLEITAERINALQALHPAPQERDDEDEDDFDMPAVHRQAAQAGAAGVAAAAWAPAPAVAAHPVESTQSNSPAITLDSIAAYCKGRERKACDYFGWAARHALKLIRRITSKDARDAFEDIVRRVGSGAVHDPELIDMLRHCKGHPIDKGNGKPRPAGSICMLMHLASGVLMRSVPAEKLRNAVGWGNLCAGVSGGTEALARFLQLYAETFRTHAIIKVDWKNAFNAIRRKALIRAAHSVTEILAIVKLHLGGDATVTYVDSSGEEHNILVKTGGIQGDPKMGFLFSKALNDVLGRIRAECSSSEDGDRKQVVIVGFADDTYVCAPPGAAIREVERIKHDAWQELDLEAQPEKSSGYIPAGPTAADAQAFEEAGIPLADGVTTASGVMATGTPVGNLEYIKSTLEAAVVKLQRLADNILALRAQVHARGKQLVVPLQGLFAIVRLCLPSTFSHFMRTVYPSIIRPYAARVDEIVLKAALEACGLYSLAKADPNDPTRCAVARRMFLPVSEGGMGVYNCLSNVDAAFLGSAALTCDTVRDLGIDPLGAGEQSQYVTELREALARVQARLPRCDEIKNWTLASLLSKSAPRLQHYISAELAKAEKADILASFPDTTKGRQARAEFAECGASKAGAWVVARPRDYLSRLNNGEWWLSTALRLGVNPYPEVSPACLCDACKMAIGPCVISHSTHCSSAGRRGRCLRHTGAKNVIATVERNAEAGTNVVMEPFIMATFGGPDSMPPSESGFARSRADLAVRTPGGANYVVDVTIVDATIGLDPANNNYVVGKGTEKAFDDKVAQYQQRFPNMDIPSQFRAAAFDFRGGASKGTVEYMQEIARREHKSNPAIPFSVVASRLYQRVSVAIQRAVAYNAMEYRYWRVPVAVPLPVGHVPVGDVPMGGA